MAFEDRIVLASYTWNGPDGGAWDNKDYWGGTNYPRTANDTANFDGATRNTSVDLSVPGGVEIGRITTFGGYNKEIRLWTPLTIKSGGGLAQSSFTSQVKIAPQHANGNLVLDGTALLVLRGELGSTAIKSELSIINSGSLSFGIGPEANRLGMNLVVGTADGGAGSGSAVFTELDAGFQNRHLMVFNDADITIHKDSTFELQGKDGDGGILDDGTTSGLVRVAGQFARTGTHEAQVHLPFLVTATGTVWVKPEGAESILTIKSDGIAGTNNKSLYVESRGKVRVGDADQPTRVATLKANKGIVFDDATLYAHGDNAHVFANTVEFINDGDLSMWDDTYTHLYFQLTGTGAKVQLTSGTWYYDLQGSSNTSDQVIVSGGNLEIDTTNSALLVSTHGTPVVGDFYYLIQTEFTTIVGDFAYKPINFTSTIYSTPGGMIYRLTRTAVPGGEG